MSILKKRLPQLLLTALILLLPLRANAETPTAHASIENVDLLACEAMDGTPEISKADAQTWNLTLGTLKMPGAYARFQVTVINDGTAVLTVRESSRTDFPAEDLYLNVMSDENAETLAPGERRILTAEVGWDSASVRNIEKTEYGSFSLTLSCTGDEIALEPGDETPDNENPGNESPGGTGSGSGKKTHSSQSDSAGASGGTISQNNVPRTGDSSRPALWMSVLFCSAAALFLAVLLYRRKH